MLSLSWKCCLAFCFSSVIVPCAILLHIQSKKHSLKNKKFLFKNYDLQKAKDQVVLEITAFYKTKHK